MSRTITFIESSCDPFPVASEWAKANSFVLVEDLPSVWTYKRKRSIICALLNPVSEFMTVSRANTGYSIQYWLYFNWFVRLSTWFILPSDLKLVGGFPFAYFQRREALKRMNHLLKLLKTCE